METPGGHVCLPQTHSHRARLSRSGVEGLKDVACYDSSLSIVQNWRLEPLLEAKVRLRYATVLHDETENSMEAEEALSKGVFATNL